MHPANFNVALVKKGGNEIVAGVGFFSYPEKDTVHIMYGAYDTAIPGKYEVYLYAFWKTITWAHENGYSEVNFGASSDQRSHPNFRFKEQFGGEFVKKYSVKITPFRVLSHPIVRSLTRAIA